MDDKKPLVSVCIPSYNHENYIEEALDSVLAQTYQNFEIIITDDASSDNSPRIIRSIQQRYPTIIKASFLERNFGPGYVPNINHSLAKGKYIAHLPSDDRMKPDRLSAQVDYLEENPNVAALFTTLDVIDECGKLVPDLSKAYTPEIKNVRWQMLHYNLFAAPSAMIRTEVIRETGDFNPGLRFTQDMDYWLRILDKRDIARLDLPLTEYRVHGKNLSISGPESQSFGIKYELVQVILGAMKRWSPEVIFAGMSGPDGKPFETVSMLCRLGRHCLNLDRQYFGRPLLATATAYSFALQAMAACPGSEEVKALLSEIYRVLGDTDRSEGRASITFNDWVENQLKTPKKTSHKSTIKADSNRGLVSVIVPTFNRAALLERALESILAQTYQNIEIVVVNDAGCSAEEVVAKCNRNNNISYVSHPTNKGLPAARNTGLRISKGDYIAYLDDDDIFLPHHLENIVSALRSGRSRFAYSYADYVLEDKRDGKVQIVGHQQPYSKIAYSRSELLIRNFIPVNTWVFERSLLDDAGFFDESFKALEDWEWLLRASAYTDFITVPEATVEVHTRLYDRGHMLAEQRPHLLKWYQKACEKHPVPPKLERARQQFVQLTFGDKEKTTQVAASPDNNARTVAPYALWAQRRQDGDRSRISTDDEGSTPVTFHFLISCARQEKSVLADALLSIRAQTWGHWTVTVLAEFTAPDSILKGMEPINWVVVEDGPPRIQALQHAVQSHTADWVVLSSPATRFASGFLSAASRYISLYSDWRLIYLDSDKIDSSGSENSPQFRPDFNLDWLRSAPYLGGTLLVQREALLNTGGVADLTPADIYDLSLKSLDCYGENSFGHIDDVLCHVHGDHKFPVSEACKKALSDHLLRNHLSAAINDGYQPGTFRIEYKHPKQPQVSIVIPTKDQVELLKACVDSILNLTEYPHYEIIIVDNNSEKAETLEYLDELVDMEGDTVRVIQYKKPFNYSAENNAAAAVARGDYLLLLNNDTQILEGDWLDKMMAYGQRPDIGIVGVRLLYPDTGKLQHAGVIMGLGGIAEHPYLGLVDATEPGYMNRLHVDQNVSAVTGACLLIRKSLYERVGGLDEVNFKICYNDVDLCLKVGQLGYKILWTPHVTLLHHGSVSQKEAARHMDKDADKARFASEKQAMLEKWLPVIARDPFYNRHLSLTQRDFRLEHQCLINWDPRLLSQRTRVLAWTLPGASCEYRVKLPLQALHRAGSVEDSYVWPSGKGTLRKLLPAEIARAKPDALTVPVCSELFHHTETLQQIRQLCKVPIVLHMDPLPTALSRISATDTRHDVNESLKKLLATADRVVVTTAPIAEFCQEWAEQIHLIPNYLPKALWEGLSSRRRRGSKPRIGWAGAMQEGGDLPMLAEVVKATAREADWVVFGMCPDELRPLVRETHPLAAFDQYAAKLANLDLDLAVAPLEDNLFNQAKSNLSLLEYGWLGWPVICSDVLSYRDAPVSRVQNRPQDWIAAIRERLHDLDAAEREGDRLREWVRAHWMLEDHLEEWVKVYSFTV